MLPIHIAGNAAIQPATPMVTALANPASDKTTDKQDRRHDPIGSLIIHK